MRTQKRKKRRSNKRQRQSVKNEILGECVDNTGYEASLEIGKVYRILPDASASKISHVRVVDESGEDYLYPDRLFQ